MKSQKSIITVCWIVAVLLLVIAVDSERRDTYPDKKPFFNGIAVMAAGEEMKEEKDGETETDMTDMLVGTDDLPAETQTLTETQIPVETGKAEVSNFTLNLEGETEEVPENIEEELSEDGMGIVENGPDGESEGTLVQAEDLKEKYTEGLFLVMVRTNLNVREEPSEESDWVGKMMDGTGGKVLEEQGDWTKIESGKVVGWVKNDYIIKGEAAAAELLENYDLVYEVTVDALKVRSTPAAEEDNKIRAVYGGQTYEVATVSPEWIQIEYTKEKYGWVAAQYGCIRFAYDEAMTKKEYKDYQISKKRVDVATTTRSATNASDEELNLLACLIQCESGSYEGMLAVANVVINRVKSSKYPNSFSEVIYAPGQFSPARSGKLDNRLAKGPSSTAIQAASDALNGTNNIGSYTHFRSAKVADLSKYAKYTIVAGNVFH